MKTALIFLMALTIHQTDTSKAGKALQVYHKTVQPYLAELTKQHVQMETADTVAHKAIYVGAKYSHKLLLDQLVAWAEQKVNDDLKNSPTNDLEELNLRIRKVYKYIFEEMPQNHSEALPDEFYSKARLAVLKLQDN